MNEDFSLLSEAELKALYHSINSQLSKQLLGGTPLDKEQPRIDTLSKISNELVKRKSATNNMEKLAS